MYGYLAQLAEQQRQPDAIGQALIGLGQTAGGIAEQQRAHQDRQLALEDRLRGIAQKKLAFVQQQGQAAALNKDDAGAAGWANQVPGLAKEAYGIDMPGGGVAGSPVFARGVKAVPTEVLGPPVKAGAAMPQVGVPTPYTYDTGRRDFSNPQSQAAARGLLGMEPAKPEYFNLSAGETRYRMGADGKPVEVAKADPKPAAGARPAQNPITGEWFIPAPGMKTDVKPEGAGRLVQDPVSGTWFTPAAGMTTTPPPRTVAVTNPDGSVTLMPTTPGQAKPIKPPPKPPAFDAGKAARDAVALFPDDKRGRASRLVQRKREQYVKNERDKAEKALAEWTSRHGAGANPNQPGSSKAARADRGILNIAPPAKYEDTQLLPHWEERAQAVLRMMPGVEISSRARSVDRNKRAGKRGGAPNSWHTHRQAFDVIKYTPEQKEKLRAWAASEGIHMRDEGNHLHFEPLRTGAADDPKMAAFYARHGITPQEGRSGSSVSASLDGPMPTNKNTIMNAPQQGAEMTPAKRILDQASAVLLGNSGSQAEYLKAYRNILGFDEGDMTEKSLSPKGVEAVRQIAANGVAGQWRPTSWPPRERPVAPKWDDEGETQLGKYVLGGLAKENVSRVTIAGKQYYQIRDIYDFDRMESIAKRLGAGHVLREIWSDPAGIQGAEMAAAYLGLKKGVNILVPVDPQNLAPDEAVEAFRAKTRVPIQNRSAGAEAVRRLLGSKDASEKVMP